MSGGVSSTRRFAGRSGRGSHLEQEQPAVAERADLSVTSATHEGLQLRRALTITLMRNPASGLGYQLGF